MAETKSKNRGLEVFLGVLLIVLSMIVLSSTVITTFATVFFIGWLLIIGGIVGIVQAFFTGKLESALLGIFWGALTLIIGVVVVNNPAMSAATLTLLIGILLMVAGLYRGISSIFQKGPGWGWVFAWGVVTFLLGLMIWQEWPFSGFWVIGVFVGVEFLILGINSLFGLNPSATNSK